MKHSLLRIFLLICLCALAIYGCDRANNRINRLAIECGITEYPGETDRIIRFKLNGELISREDLRSATIGSSDITSRVTAKGCIVLYSSDKGDFALIHKDKRHAYLANFQTTYQINGSTEELQAFDHLQAIPEASSRLFENFCSEKSRQIFLPSPTMTVQLNFDAFTKLPGLDVAASVSHATESRNVELYSSLLAVSASKRIFSIQLADDSTLSGKNEYRVRLHVKDLFGSRLASEECTITVSRNLPEIASIAEREFFQKMYVETDNLKNLGFAIKSEIPVQEMALTYRGKDTSKTEVYVPFNISEGSWQVIAPRPNLSGPFTVYATIRDAADREVTREFSVDFGQKIYLENGAKIVKSSQNERFLLASNYKGLVKVIDLASNRVVFNFDTKEEVAFADISPSGNLVALSLNKQTLVMDITTGRTIELSKGLKNSKIAFVSEEELLGIDNYQTILVFNSRNGEIKWSIESPDKVTSWILANPTKLVAATHSHKIIEAELDPTRSTLLQLTECNDGTVDTVAASTSLKKIAFNCGQNVVVYSRETNSKQILYSHGDGVRTIEFSPDDEWLSSGTAAGEWRIQNIVDGRFFPKDRVEALEKSFRFKSSVNTIKFSADSSFVSAGADDGEIHIFSVENSEVIQSIATEGRIQQSGWLNQKKVYFAGSQDGSVRLIEVKASDKVIELSEKVENISVNNKLFAVGTSLSAEAGEGILPGAHLYSLETFTEIAKISHKKKVNSALISNNEDWFLTASEDGKARLMNLASREVIDVGIKFRRPEAPVRAGFFSGSGQKLGLISDNITTIFNAQNTENPLLSVMSDDWTSAASFSLFDRYLVTAAADNFARILDAETGSVLGKYEAQSWIWSAKVSNDGRYFANINWDNQLIIQQIIPNTLTGKVDLVDYLKLDLQTSGENLDFSSDARFLAFSLWDGSTYLINLPSKHVMLLTCLKGDFASPPIFSKSGELVAVGQDNSAIVYRTSDGKPIQLIRHGDRVTSIGFGGDSVITGGWDGKIKMNRLNLTKKANCSFAR